MRNFNEMSPITMCFASKTSPLIKIDVDRNISYYNSENEKLSALKQAKDTDKFIIAWSGQWNTDVFHVTQNDIDDILISKHVSSITNKF
jgi:hypothetical protein